MTAAERDKRLRIVRLLLAKADSTEYVEEADALLSKAEQMMKGIPNLTKAEVAPEPKPVDNVILVGVVHMFGRAHPIRIMRPQEICKTCRGQVGKHEAWCHVLGA